MRPGVCVLVRTVTAMLLGLSGSMVQSMYWLPCTSYSTVALASSLHPGIFATNVLGSITVADDASWLGAVAPLSVAELCDAVVDDGVALTVTVLAGLLCVLVEQAVRARGRAASSASRRRITSSAHGRRGMPCLLYTSDAADE